MIYYPDSYNILYRKDIDESPIIKVFAGWRGGYCTGDSWKLSSGTTKIDMRDNLWYLEQYSGSCYILCEDQDQGRHSSWVESVLGNILREVPDFKFITIEEAISILERNTNA